MGTIQDQESKTPEIVADGILLLIGYFTSISKLSFWQNTIIYVCLGIYYLLLKGLPNPKKVLFLKYTLLTMLAVAIGIAQFYLAFWIITFFEGEFEFFMRALIMGIVHGLVIGVSVTIYQWIEDKMLVKSILSKLNARIRRKYMDFLTKYGAKIILWVLLFLLALSVASLLDYFQFSEIFGYSDASIGLAIVLGAIPTLLIYFFAQLNLSGLLLLIIVCVGVISPIFESLLLLRVGQQKLNL